ncbi:NAD(P)H-binding protein [Mesorhizobium sp. BR1-1-16]|uniref:NAD(P)H-binding protein n=1 Tax=Mesorhizobium sp. BR1-1-16 TaxID=2876653 RepID=UPI001CC991A5|nr:NAD(P)H-binding protein [Mesorhizobium sp. BR1-1-16]MBZ9935050.1 NAD(P)H-binding protein [Mesorhizobium sp. BR1-1-16]
MTSDSTLLVTGASGHLGRQVIEALLAAKAGKVIGTTRDPAKLADLAAKGADIRHADFDKPETLAAAFAGADRMLLISTDAVGADGRRIAQQRAAVKAAVAAGVKHIVYLSAPAPYPTPEPSLIGDHYWTEQAIAASGADFTFLRDHLYTDLLLYSLPHAIETGTLYTATGTGGRSYVTREDCAHTATAVLAKATGKSALDVTGPAPLTQDEIAALASEISGKPVKHVAVPAEGLRQGLTAAGLPAGLVEGLVAFDVAAAEGFHAITTSVVKDWTGREPQSVRDFLFENRTALAPKG